MALVLVLGGISSGKSRFAEDWIARQAPGQPVLYVATVQAAGADAELQRKLDRHRARRPAHWTVREVVGTAALAAAAEADAGQPVLLDGLGLAVAAAIAEGDGREWWEQVERVAQRPGWTVVVSDEVGLGMVPLTPEGRKFADTLGECHQQLAAFAQQVIWVAAGIPVWVKGRDDGAQS
ncbi:MAG: bifunctional adenosylcobinamide kinase/adenosylcobinamide-phosphate guanylyltransferase [Thermaerobacter sp.]|nr:bifunctional adenosylcobinamide kinase/adenosylcobinamide-phosphate guanylyltransferase [Thermaerobacter sp.]